MSFGRVCGVHSNPNHEATALFTLGGVVEAYCPESFRSDAACDTRGVDFDFLLSAHHSVRFEPKYLNPFKAVTDAYSLRWEVLQDLSHFGLHFAVPFARCGVDEVSSPCISQGSLAKKHRRLCVRFEDRIDVLLGCEDSWNMFGISVRHDALLNWPSKPWSKRRIAHVARPKQLACDGSSLSDCGFFLPRVDILFSDIGCLAPLSTAAVLSRLPAIDDLCDFSIITSDVGSDFALSALLNGSRLPENDTDDVMHIMQLQHRLLSVDTALSSDDSNASSDWGYPDNDWLLDLKRIFRSSLCVPNPNEDVGLEVYTWFLDHEAQLINTCPKFTRLGPDPPDWEEELKFPWRFHLQPDQRTHIQVVAPFPPTASVETHVAHVLLTQRPTDLSSILLSVEFEHGDLPDVIVRTAVAVGRTISRDQLVSLVPALQWAPPECLQFSAPQAIQQVDFQTWPGLCIRIKVDCLHMQPSELTQECSTDDSSLFQVATALQLPSMQPDRVASPKLQSFDSSAPSCSFTDEFIEAINAANQAADFEVPLIDTRSIEAQPESIQTLWDRFLATNAAFASTGTGTCRVESWFLDPYTFQRCHNSRIVLLDEQFWRWKDALSEAWRDRLNGGTDFEVVLVHPESEDKAQGVIAQILITKFPVAERRSALLSVHDSDADLERNPYTFALVLPRPVDFLALLDLLQLRNICPPAIWTNQCSLWYGTVPVSAEHPIFAFNGQAFRLVISRGICMDLANLLALDDVQLRHVLQQALSCDFHARPPEPSFTSMATPVRDHPFSHPVSDGRPPWILALQQRFDQCVNFDASSSEAFAWIHTWFLNADFTHHCSEGKNVRITAESFMWRTDIIFAWRDSLVRATPAEFSVVEGLPARTPDLTSLPHVIVSQGLPNQLHPVLVSVHCNGQMPFVPRQFAHAFATRIEVNEVVRLALPSGFQHLTAIVQFAGLTYLPGEVLHVQAGNHLTVLHRRMLILQLSRLMMILICCKEDWPSVGSLHLLLLPNPLLASRLCLKRILICL